ncbi:MAG: tRNA (N(6)-L-threonylcarbamoyladenosine(37)-C(2))-methylthiotransferase MtaB [Cyclobacteriaceae bacterium]|nr:tRNA (N(6)-L-threonylcarbamoyladenosine(37)-C(2))-methylthiotransferase MtaB [Cyclobacteriaceae bacterium]
MKKVAFYTLGCKLNFSETSSVGRMFEEKGFEKVDFEENPDIFIINTCSVTENADKKCSSVVKQARKVNPNAFVAVMGCFAQLQPHKVASIDGVDAVLGASEKFRLFQLIENFEKQPETLVFASNIENATEFHSSYSLNDRTRTFLKVQDGCDYSCTFCTIPQARGASRSDTPDNIISKANDIVETGVKEIVLTGINTGDYGIVNGVRQFTFTELIKRLNEEVNNIERIRISSIEPNLITDEIIKIASKGEKIAPHFHIPLQSGSDIILKKMRRRYLTGLYTEKIDAIRKYIPDACIGVDIIVGFPGESEEEFLKTYKYLSDLDISYLHVFSYSERENTLAAEMDAVVPVNERQRRSQMLRILSEKKRRNFYESQIGRIRPVLFEKAEKNGLIEGFTDNYIKVSAESVTQLSNQIVWVELTSVNELGIMEFNYVKEEIR